MIKISIAIPVYNTAKHLDVMFDSLLHQTMASTDFEIICVNDCSTDNSKEVIEQYRKIMPNIVLIDRIENSGAPSIPRNDAIDAARGEYIHFLDSDDFLGEEALERLYKAAKMHQSDVIFGRHVSVNGRRVPMSMFGRGNRPKADILADNLLYSLAPHKMFNLTFLRKYGFNFHPAVKAGNEDQLFVVQCYVAANVITVQDDYPYYFVVARGDESISSKIYPAAVYFYVYYLLMEFLNDFIYDVHYRNTIKSAFFDALLKKSRWPKYLVTERFTQEQKIEWLHELKKLVDTHLHDDIIKSIDPRLYNLLEAAKENNLAKLSKLRYENGSYVYKL